MAIKIQNKSHLCDKPRTLNGEKVCGCGNPKECLAVMYMNERCRHLFKDEEKLLEPVFL